MIGYHVAGVLGGLVTTLAMCGPTCVFAYFVGRTSDRFKGAAWHSALSRGLVPVTLGLLASSATVIATTSDYSWLAVVITAGTAITGVFRARAPAVGLCRGRRARRSPGWSDPPQRPCRFSTAFWACPRFVDPSFNAKLAQPSRF